MSGLGNAMIDEPKILGRADVVAARGAQLAEPHVAPLTACVEALRTEHPGAGIPYFDPWDGGIGASVLFLLEAPGPQAVRSGFVSCNNPDETARNFHGIMRAAGIPRSAIVTWNVVPWYLGDGRKIRPATAADIREAAPALGRLLDLLPGLRAGVLIGRKAQRIAPEIERLRPGLRLFKSPHPSPMFINREPGNRERVVAALREVAAAIA